MKIRNRFVSNSSTSSFILEFDKDAELNYEFFESIIDKDILASSDYNIDKVINSLLRAVSEFEELSEKEKIKAIKDVFYCQELRESFDFDDFKNELKRKSKKAYDKVKTLNNNKKYFTVSFGDDDSFGSFMEHSEVFEKAVFLRVSNH